MPNDELVSSGLISTAFWRVPKDVNSNYAQFEPQLAVCV
jgi:hypothetical protein